MTILRVIDTAALREEGIKEYSRLLTASVQALNKLRSAQDAYEVGEGTLADVHRARRAWRKSEKATDAAELAAYGPEETAERRAAFDAMLADVKEEEAAWLASPEFAKRRRDFENQRKYGARLTRHTGFTVIEGQSAPTQT